jgi:hypothetical protein
MRFLIAALLSLWFGTVWAAPADDGQTAGSRLWTLNQARSGIAVTASDSTDLTPKPTRAIFIGGSAACNIAVRMADDGTTAVTLANVQPGQVLPIQVNRVMSTNTTCTGIVAFY